MDSGIDDQGSGTSDIEQSGRTPNAVRVETGAVGPEPGWLAMREALWPDCDRETHQVEMAAWLAEPGRCEVFLARAPDGELVGFVEASIRSEPLPGTLTAPRAWIEGLYVAPGHRRRGVAAAMIDAASQWAAAAGCGELISDADPDNSAGLAMHRALGFRETERAVLFSRRIDPAPQNAEGRLRLARVDDLDELLPLVRACGESEGIAGDDERRRAAVLPLLGDAGLGQVWLMVDGGAVVGYLALCFGYSIEMGGRDAFVDEIYVLPAHRGRALAKAALAAVRKPLAALGVRALHLKVARDNDRARRFCSSAGFGYSDRYDLVSLRLVD